MYVQWFLKIWNANQFQTIFIRVGKCPQTQSCQFLWGSSIYLQAIIHVRILSIAFYAECSSFKSSTCIFFLLPRNVNILCLQFVWSICAHYSLHTPCHSSLTFCRSQNVVQSPQSSCGGRGLRTRRAMIMLSLECKLPSSTEWLTVSMTRVTPIQNWSCQLPHCLAHGCLFFSGGR